MFLVRRPDKPENFDPDTREAREAIQVLVDQGTRPTRDDFPPLWSAFKHLLAEAQHGRCGYCDRKVLGGDDGTVDHFRPKAEIAALSDDPATWGQQKRHSASVTGRELQRVHELGYHWLAYAWDNYVFACSCCNEKWKRTLFPVATHPRCCPPRPGSYEEPLLLHCYHDIRPSDHLQFNADGTVEARNRILADGTANPLLKSRYGEETIRTVGLYRDALCDERKHVAEDVFEALRQFAEGDEATSIASLKRLGGEKRPFAGVVRAIVEVETGFSWTISCSSDRRPRAFAKGRDAPPHPSSPAVPAAR